MEITLELKCGHLLIIDSIDHALLDQYGWCLDKRDNTCYVKRIGRGSTIHIHRLIMERILARNLLRTELVDHKNRNGLDNRRSNLRLVTHSQNMKNRKLQVNNSSGYRGVFWRKDAKKWQAQIKVEGRFKSLGTFTEIEDAALAYKEAAQKYYGEYAPQDSK